MYKIMLVDDEPIILKGLVKMIDWDTLGLSPITMVSASSALEFAKAEQPDIILTDIHMDEMDGLTMIKEYNKCVSNGSIVIVLSGYSEFKDAKEAVKINAFDYLSKPVSKEELQQTLTKAIQTLNNKKDDLIKKRAYELSQNYNFTAQTKQDFDKKVADYVSKLSKLVNTELGANPNLNEVTSFSDGKTLGDWINRQVIAFCDNEESLKLKEETDMMYKAEMYIRRNFSKQISLDDVAATVYMTPTYFCTAFKKSYKVGFHNFLLEIRMKEALKLLQQNSYKIYEIAEKVGFKNSRYFGETFKKFYGALPTDYKAIKNL